MSGRNLTPDTPLTGAHAPCPNCGSNVRTYFRHGYGPKYADHRPRHNPTNSAALERWKQAAAAWKHPRPTH